MPWRDTSAMEERYRFVMDAQKDLGSFHRVMCPLRGQHSDRLQMDCAGMRKRG